MELTMKNQSGYFRLKLSPTSGHCPWWLVFQKKKKNYLNNCKETMNIGGSNLGCPF